VTTFIERHTRDFRLALRSTAAGLTPVIEAALYTREVGGRK
jgi:hypothetical protein